MTLGPFLTPIINIMILILIIVREKSFHEYKKITEERILLLNSCIRSLSASNSFLMGENMGLRHRIERRMK